MAAVCLRPSQVMEDRPFADKVWARLRERVGPAIEMFVAREPGCSAPQGLTERIRLLRYEGSDRFDPHYDRVSKLARKC